MHFYAVRLKDCILWVLGALIILFALGVFTGQTAERAELSTASAEGNDIFNLSVVPSPAPDVKTEEGFSLEVLSASGVQKKCRIYIYHTHTYEAYLPSERFPYVYKEKWRTNDPEKNVVRVGTELAALLVKSGFTVFHDQTAYEPPKLSTAYARSLEGLQKTLADGEPYDLYIDLHRDSYSVNNGANVAAVGSDNAARLMFLIGKGTGSTFDVAPDWEKNLKIADFLKERMNARYPGLCRETKKKSGRYNQHIASACLLLEVGNNQNTLDEALASLPPLVEALCAYFDQR